MNIVIGADSAGKPLLDVIAAHLKTKPGVTVTDVDRPGFYADIAQALA
ncbi:MAG: RpiB/LacA/LacB family sugar-phosphate isomerase, partial [Alphaproteobacteria bacterium]